MVPWAVRKEGTGKIPTSISSLVPWAVREEGKFRRVFPLPAIYLEKIKIDTTVPSFALEVAMAAAI